MRRLIFFAFIAVVLALVGVPSYAQTLQCSAPYVTYDSSNAPTIGMACIASGLGLGPHSLAWDTGRVSITPFAASGFTMSDYHGTATLTNSLSGSICNSDCSILTVTSMANTGSGTYTATGDISYTVASVEMAGTFHVDNVFSQCGPFGICSFTVTMALH